MNAVWSSHSTINLQSILEQDHEHVSVNNQQSFPITTGTDSTQSIYHTLYRFKSNKKGSVSDADCSYEKAVLPRNRNVMLKKNSNRSRPYKVKAKECKSLPPFQTRKKLYHKVCDKVPSPSSDDSESSFVDYLQTLSACPDLDSCSSRDSSPKFINRSSKNESVRTKSESGQQFQLNQPCQNFPRANVKMSVLKQQMSLPLPNTLPNPDETLSSSCLQSSGNSDDATEMAVSDFSEEETIDQVASENDANKCVVLRKIERNYETDTSVDSSMLEPRHLAHKRFLNKRKERWRKLKNEEIGALEEELKSLENQLGKYSDSEVLQRRDSLPIDLKNNSRGLWSKDQETVIKSWSTELFGNFTDNEKVRFSYENLQSSCTSLAASSVIAEQTRQNVVQNPGISPLAYQNQNLSGYLPSVQEHRVMQHTELVQSHEYFLPFNQYNPYTNIGDEYNSMPEPVESLVKHFKPVQSNATHEKYSPQPNRKSPRRMFNRTFSSPSTPTAEVKPFCLQRVNSLRDHRRTQSLSEGGAVGVTSMWIPVVPTPKRKPSIRMKAENGLSLAKKVLLQHVLPSKSEGSALTIQTVNVCKQTAWRMN